MRNFIFGYGSLIESSSRTRTSPNATDAYPVEIAGLQRGWWARVPVSGLSTTFLGCAVSENDRINGVLFEVDVTDLKKMDIREEGYDRIVVDNAAIKDYCEVLTEKDQVWVYVNSNFSAPDFIANNIPNKDFPIVQSYVDICINGCLELEAQFPFLKEEQFLQKFISETKYWNAYWVNDRIYPRRPFIYCPNAYTIDTLLQKHLTDPHLFHTIYFE